MPDAPPVSTKRKRVKPRGRRRFKSKFVSGDAAFIMRDLGHEWHQADDLYALPKLLNRSEEL